VTGSAPRVESFAAEPRRLEAFERVRAAVGLYAAAGAEPVALGTTCLLAWRGDDPVARATVHAARDLHDAPGLTGLVGHYEALDQEAGVAVLEAACRALSEQRVDRVLGPMNGSTWARYRLTLRSGPEGLDDPAPFLAEPWNPARYPEDFGAAGFVVESRYESRLVEPLDREPADAAELAASVRARGLRVRSLDLDRFEAELALLHEMSLAGFADNLYYAPIGFEAFRAQYDKVRPLVDPELVLIAEDASGQAVAFQFAYRDPLTPPGQPPRAVVKTIATIPAARGKGLAGHLFDLVHRRAHDRGCRSAIHALMHVQNLSTRMSARLESRPFRRYALYRWAP
jgi:GNAT superfamily N-acetyltransferase